MDELSFEDREVMIQVLAGAGLTDRQRECLAWQLAGLTQEEVGRVLGIAQPVVAQHFAASLRKVGEIAPRYL